MGAALRIATIRGQPGSTGLRRARLLTMAGVHGAGGALVIPNLSALVSSRSRSGAGLALGLKNSASGLGQFLGPFIGGSLTGVRAELPFLLAAALLTGIAVAVRIVLAPGERSPTWLRPIDPTRDEDEPDATRASRVAAPIPPAVSQLPSVSAAA